MSVAVARRMSHLLELQARVVDAVKRHAIGLSLASPSAEAWILEGYLWSEECAEGLALARAVSAQGPSWLGRLLDHQLADEGRHATLLRGRLDALPRRKGGARAAPGGDPSVAAGALARRKLGQLERLCARASPRFSRGSVVPLLACAARLEATGVRVFGRHLGVLEARGQDDDTAQVLRAILADERRHARSCTAALERLVEPDERRALAALEVAIARVDRSLGVASSLALWLVVAAYRARDGVAGRARSSA